jgi:hypothetical protein
MQTLVTLLIVLAAAGYSVWKLAPASLRHRLAAQSGNIARATGASERTARRIEIKALDAAANASGCGGGCGPCKGCATGQDKDDGGAA